MGMTISRNRFWYFRSMYDEYLVREVRRALLFGSFIWLPAYWWGIHINRELEADSAQNNYVNKYGPLRMRLTHSMLFEEFEMVLEDWKRIQNTVEEDN